jgi:hypothetical protein
MKNKFRKNPEDINTSKRLFLWTIYEGTEHRIIWNAVASSYHFISFLAFR